MGKGKIQEIKGTVKVEGTVEVTGKVQVEGGSVTVEGAATKESLLKRAKMCCAEKQWKKQANCSSRFSTPTRSVARRICTAI